MGEQITLDGVTQDVSGLSASGQALAAQIAQVQRQIDERQRLRAVLLMARKAYLTELRAEIIKQKSGVDLSRLLDDI